MGHPSIFLLGVAFLLHFIKIYLGLFDRINEFVEHSLLLNCFLLSVVALRDQVVVLSLDLEKIQVYLFNCPFIVIFQHVEIGNHIVFPIL